MFIIGLIFVQKIYQQLVPLPLFHPNYYDISENNDDTYLNIDFLNQYLIFFKISIVILNLHPRLILALPAKKKNEKIFSASKKYMSSFFALRYFVETSLES